MAKILTSSDSSLCVQFGDAISEEINDRVRAFALAVEAARFPGVVELVPTYRSVTVHYRPEVVGYARLYEQLTRVLTDLAPAALPAPKTVSVPVLYGGAWGPDLGTVAALHGLSEEEVIARHTAPEYRVYMLGFLPGFCYLGGLDERLATPRLSTPRVSIPAGSVCQAIGNPLYSLIVSVCRQLVVLIPAAWLLAQTGNLNMVWFAFPIAELMSLLLSSVFLRRTLRRADAVMAIDAAEI